MSYQRLHKNTDIEVESSCIFRGSMVEQAGTRTIVEEKLVAEDYTFSLEDGESRQLEKIVCNVTSLAKKEEGRTERILDRTFLQSLKRIKCGGSRYGRSRMLKFGEMKRISREYGFVFSRCFRLIMVRFPGPTSVQKG